MWVKESLKASCLLLASVTGLEGQTINPQKAAPPIRTEMLDPATLERETYALLDSFVGEWVGTLIVSDSKGRIIQLVTLNQAYWWEDAVLKGLATYGNDERLEYAFSETSIQNGTIIAVIREGTQSKLMKATPTEHGLIWVPDDPSRFGSEQSSEYITTKDGKEILVIEGFERVITPPLETRILIRAELIKQS